MTLPSCLGYSVNFASLQPILLPLFMPNLKLNKVWWGLILKKKKKKKKKLVYTHLKGPYVEIR